MVNPSDPAFDLLQTYNGMDCIATLELFNKLLPQLDNDRSIIYNQSLALQAPVLEMNLHGLRVNPDALRRVLSDTEKKQETLLANFAYMTSELVGKPVLPSSWQQLQYLFYERLGYPPVKVSKKGVTKISTDAEAMEKLILRHPELQPLCDTIIALRTNQTRFRVYRSGIDNDQRMRCSYSIAGTETGRFSSSKNAFHGGTNLQNIPEDARHIFVSDPRYKFAYIDLEQAESRTTALSAYAISGLHTYLDACDSGDLHTTVAKMVWRTELPWTGDNKKDRAIAEQLYYRDKDYRFMCKKIGHGTNYYGKAFSISRQARVPQKLVADFQTAYLEAFPEISLYHRYVIRTLQQSKRLTTLLHRVRTFFNRPNDDATIREAIAFVPQSLVADILNRAILNVWGAHIPGVSILAQIHDALIIQYPEDKEEESLAAILPLMSIPISATCDCPTSPNHGITKTITIPNSVETGWNWGKYDADKNPDGIKKYRGPDTRVRQYDPKASILDRPVL